MSDSVEPDCKKAKETHCIFFHVVGVKDDDGLAHLSLELAEEDVPRVRARLPSGRDMIYAKNAATQLLAGSFFSAEEIPETEAEPDVLADLIKKGDVKPIEKMPPWKPEFAVVVHPCRQLGKPDYVYKDPAPDQKFVAVSEVILREPVILWQAVDDATFHLAGCTIRPCFHYRSQLESALGLEPGQWMRLLPGCQPDWKMCGGHFLVCGL